MWEIFKSINQFFCKHEWKYTTLCSIKTKHRTENIGRYICVKCEKWR
jgi:hypothetical protein